MLLGTFHLKSILQTLVKLLINVPITKHLINNNIISCSINIQYLESFK